MSRVNFWLHYPRQAINWLAVVPKLLVPINVLMIQVD